MDITTEKRFNILKPRKDEISSLIEDLLNADENDCESCKI